MWRPIVAGDSRNKGAAAREEIRAFALTAGFDAVGFAPATGAPETAGRLREFLASGMQGDMGWLEAKADRRVSPDALWPDARTVVVLGMNYGPDIDPLAILDRRDLGGISVYAQGRDYHDVVKKRLKQVARWMHDNFAAEVKVFVDTAPVMEKPLAMRGGIGWQGKHTNMVSREFGSWLFLGEIFTALDLPPDPPETDHCGGCSRCLDVCPTRAFTGPYRLDPRRCISYLTIEHTGHIAAEFREAMGNRIYGCDDCLAVCPWNKFARPTGEPALMPREALSAPRLSELARLDDAAFRACFAASPVKRTGRDRFVRNVLIAIGNSGDLEHAVVVRERLDDRSPLVRAMAVWALRRLMPPPEFSAIRRAKRDAETDPDVIAEWEAPAA